MEDEKSTQDASTSEVTSSESTVEINVKTLDSQIYTFHVEKDMPVLLVKEKIATAIGIPVGQQRLIFRGKVLKDDHHLSDYYVEDGVTLHLVARQPAHSQTSGATNSGEASGNTGTQGNDSSTGAGPGAGASRNRVGQVSHSVVLGTFNVGEQGEGIVPDLTRIIGAVLNSVGVGNQIPMAGTANLASNIPSNASSQASQGVEAEGARGNVGGRGGQPIAHNPFQSLPQSMQFPFAGAPVNLPSHHMPIPDSLTTLAEFISRMEAALSVNGSNSSSPVNAGDPPRVALPSNARGLPNAEALIIVMRQAQQLLSDHVVTALSNLAGRLEGESFDADPAVRNQIQTETVRVGQGMQHLGSLFLELGRTILMLRMGRSPAESLVNAGPAVYISPSGPNPIMVQPFPLQTSSMFVGPAGNTAQTNPGMVLPVGLGEASRNVNIHIHAGTSLAGVPSVGPRANSGEVPRGEHHNGIQTGDSGPMRVLPVRNVIATAVPSHFPGDSGVARNILYPSHARAQQNNQSVTTTVQGSDVAAGGVVQPNVATSASASVSESAPIPTLVTQIPQQIRDLFRISMRGDSRAPSEDSTNLSELPDSSGSPQQVTAPSHGADETAGLPGCVTEREGKQQQPQCHQLTDEKTRGSGATIKAEAASGDAPRSSKGHDSTEGAKDIPLGLGLGGLQPKARRTRQGRSQGKNADGTSAGLPINLNQQSIAHGQQVLQSLASRGSDASRQLAPALEQTVDTTQLPIQSSSGQFDAASMMSQVMNSPALNGLLAGVSEQAGMGSPDGLRNMFEQFTSNPSMRNTLNQITQQLDVQELGNMFSGMGSGQGGGMDLSRMIQQMMPIVSQSLSRVASQQESSRAVDPRPEQQRPESRTVRDSLENRLSQIDFQPTVERIERHDPPADILRSVVENAVRLYGGNISEEFIEELCSDEDLANEFMEMLRRDISLKLHWDSGSNVDSLL